MRGLAGIEAAQLSGAGHLLSFCGTDTVPALPWIEHYYPGHWPGMRFDETEHKHQGGDCTVIGGTVPATEHSVMCAGGAESERATFERLLNLYPRGVVSVVSDTWDLWKVLTETLPSLRERIMARDGKLVIRPDSGNPADVLCGLSHASKSPAEQKGVVELLWDAFGGTTNAAGFRELDRHVGVIYGDAITYERAQEIIERLRAKGFASTNVVFGIGSFNYQYVTRDTLGFAMKATWARIRGEGVELWKKPVTDTGEKHSARGRLAVLPGDDGRLVLHERATMDQEAESLLRPVWRDGRFLRTQSFHNVRSTLWGSPLDGYANGTNAGMVET